MTNTAATCTARCLTFNGQHQFDPTPATDEERQEWELCDLPASDPIHATGDDNSAAAPAVNNYLAQRLADAQAKAAERARALPDFIRAAGAIRADVCFEVSTADELRAALVTIGGHNDYDPRVTAELLAPLVADMMRVEITHNVEGPYIYLTLPHYDGHRLAHLGTSNTGEKITAERRIDLAEQVIAAGIAAHADMVRVSQSSQPNGADVVHRRPGKTPHTITLWWD